MTAQAKAQAAKNSTADLSEQSELVELVELTVARGRTVVDVTGKSKGPGEIAVLDADDVERLGKLGFLVIEGQTPVLRRGPATLSEG